MLIYSIAVKEVFEIGINRSSSKLKNLNGTVRLNFARFLGKKFFVELGNDCLN